jgi:hypothetical protein
MVALNNSWHPSHFLLSLVPKLNNNNWVPCDAAHTDNSMTLPSENAWVS